MVTDLGRERESNACLKRCSVLGPSSHNAPVLDSDLIGHIQVRGNLERSPSFEGNIYCFTDVQVINCFDKNNQKSVASSFWVVQSRNIISHGEKPVREHDLVAALLLGGWSKWVEGVGIFPGMQGWFE